MDNLTHSLTGAVASKFIESRSSAPEEKARFRRSFFWLFVVAANLPDIDVLLGLTGDPLLSIRFHRGLTHSLLFAPFLALLPAVAFRVFSSVKNIRLLWIISLLGILLHIFFDLVTSFGTQILNPVSETRFALDWVFIVDPVLTFGLAVFLLLGRWLKAQRRVITTAGVFFMVGYILLAAAAHGIAFNRIHEAARTQGTGWTRISAVPQPLSFLNWHGLIQTEDGVLQTFFSLLDSTPPEFRKLKHDEDRFSLMAAREPEAGWFLSFARHPWVQSFREDSLNVVEFRDLMYSIDTPIARTFGFTERSLPFQLRFTYDDQGTLLGVQFDGKPVERDIQRLLFLH